jgi:chromosome segregation ATPase
MKNNLFINRLVVYTREGLLAYDEEYHKGVNIIRGENSSGKSTISHFIFFVLGGHFSDFVPEARKCSVVYAEVEMNGAVFTIKRYIEFNDERKVNPKAALHFYWGKYNEAYNPPPDKGWQRFEYFTTKDKKSYSNVIFENLNIPIVRGDNNITIHQILRLLYVDQESPTSSLYYYEQFDSQLTRETTADLLLGVYDESLYENKIRLIDAERELDSVKAQIKATRAFFNDPLSLNPSHLKTAIENKQIEIVKLEEEIIKLKEKGRRTRANEIKHFRFQQLSEQIITQRLKVTALQEKIKQLQFELDDNEFFVSTLKEKIKALKNSVHSRELLGSLPITYCPECLSKIKASGSDSTCKLCKEEIDASYGITQARRLEQEISFQIKETNSLQTEYRKDLNLLQSEYEAEYQSLNQMQKMFDLEMKDVKTSSEEALERLLVDKGFLEGVIVQLNTLLENAELYQRLIRDKNSLQEEIDTLRLNITRTITQQERMKEAIKDKIRQEAIYLLNNDLHRQDEFKNARDFHIDFSNNIAFLSNEYAKYSASSNFYMKITARFALFLASLSINNMRYPRFILADNMEDKGIEEKRAQNFQKIVIDRLKQFDTKNYQVIFMTSYLSEELNNTDLCVGPYYTKENRTLKNV